MATWENFYVIVGSSAGALIGLQFVVMTLIADDRRVASRDGLSAFGTPTVVHLGAALLLSAIASVPWRSLSASAVWFLVCGLSGLAYSAIVLRRARRQTDYAPVWQDWLWYTALPSLAYAVLAGAAVLLFGERAGALFFVAASTLTLLFVGIHNAWDTVTHIVMAQREKASDRDKPADVTSARQIDA